MSQQQKTKVTKASKCNCGKVEISVTGNDKGSVLCHCDNCKKASGSAFAHNHRFTSAELQILKGGDVIREYRDNNTKSGTVLSRHFCSNCGCPMYLANPTFKNFYVLHGGNIDGRAPQPTMELFQEDRYQWLGDVTSKSKM